MGEYNSGYEPELNQQSETPEQKSSWRLRMAFEAQIKTMVGEVQVDGLDNLKEIPKDRKIVIATSHISDLDVPITVYALSNSLDLLITNQSSHYSFKTGAGEKLGMSLVGKENFMPIDYKFNEASKKIPDTFNPQNFENMLPMMEKGKAIVMAAHNPSSDGHLGKGGYGAIYLAEIGNAIIVPVGVNIKSKDGEQLGMADNNIKTLSIKPDVDVKIGVPFELERIEGLEEFQTILEKRKSGEKISDDERAQFSVLKDQLENRSKELMDRIAALVPEEKR